MPSFERRFEKRKFFPSENPEDTHKSKVEMEKQESGLVSLKEEINKVIQEYSAETFRKARKEKTEEIDIELPEGWDKTFPPLEKGKMKKYPSKISDFRERGWLDKLEPEEQEKAEFEIMKYIHETVGKTLWKMHSGFLETLPGEVQEYFKENRKRKGENKEKILPSEELEEGVISAIEGYKKQFGFPPGDPYVLEYNCAGFTNFVGRVFEHYGFKSGLVNTPGHVISLVQLKGNKNYVSDVNYSEPLPLRKWIETENIKIEDITPGYFGGYESSTHFNLGRLLQRLKRYYEAEKEYREALMINPRNIDAHNNLWVLFEDLARFHEAEIEYEKAIEINPNDGAFYFNLGFLHKRKGENDKARNEILTAKNLYEEKGMEKDVKKCKVLLEEIPANLPKKL